MLPKDELEKRAGLIADGYEGICPPWEIHYISHIQTVSRQSLRAFARFESLAVTHPQHRNPDEAFEALQLALTHAAAVSRFFKPSRRGIGGLSAARGTKLSVAFGVNETSPLINRSLRDAIEHYDERLDEYLLDPKMGNTVAIGLGADAPAPDSASFALRWINLVDGNVQVLGRDYDYSQTKKEITRIMLVADRFMLNGCRLPKPEPT